MRIVHISATKSGGAGRAAWRLHEAMLEHGVDSYFYSNDDYGKITGDQRNGRQLYTPLPTTIQDRLSYKWRRFWLFRNNRQNNKKLLDLYNSQFKEFVSEFSGLPFGAQNLRLISDLRRADAIILHWVNSTIDIDHFFADFKDVPVIWTLHDMNPFQGIFHYKNDEVRNAPTSRALDEKVRSLKKNAYRRKKNRMAVVAPSRWLADEAKNSRLLGSYPVDCIPYSLNLSTYTVKDRQALRSRFGLMPEQKVILFISDNVQNVRKGFDLLLGALSGLSESNIVLLALGSDSGESKTTIPVRFVGKVYEDELLADYFNAADLFILPSREDNLPNVMLEAFACGCPVVGFPIGGVKEHVREGITGILAESVDEHALAKAISSFLINFSKYSRSTIRAYAEQNFNTSVQVNRYKSIIEGL
jgi:glycosyltransferase involved in cell wall biosynthesis